MLVHPTLVFFGDKGTFMVIVVIPANILKSYIIIEGFIIGLRDA